MSSAAAQFGMQRLFIRSRLAKRDQLGKRDTFQHKLTTTLQAFLDSSRYTGHLGFAIGVPVGRHAFLFFKVPRVFLTRSQCAITELAVPHSNPVNTR